MQPHVFFGDARDMGELPDASVALVVTSPPYWQLKDYGTREQLGYDQDFDAYVSGLAQVWAEARRTLVPGGVLAINIGDQYTRTSTYGRYRVLPIRERVLASLLDLGLDHAGTIIWRKVTTCNNGTEAVEYYRKTWERIDLVMLDMVMPEMSGRETFLAMRRINPDIRALLSSGYSLNGEAQGILDEGMKGFLQKPFHVRELARAVAETLQS